MPTVKSKKKKPKKEVNDGEEQGEGETVCSSVLLRSVLFSSTKLSVFSSVGLEMEMEEVTSRGHCDSRDPLTPEPQDPAPQKKKKKKKALTIGRTTVEDQFSVDERLQLRYLLT